MDQTFWEAAGHEFESACRSRFVDCGGWESFAENLDQAQVQFGSDPTLPKDVSFSHVLELLPLVVSFWEGLGVIPKTYELPTLST